MPELPEVETVRIGLSQLIVGKAIKTVDHDTDKSFPNAPADVQAFLIGASVAAVNRRAKVLLIELSSKYTLVIHLKMTGQLVFIGSHLVGTGIVQGSPVLSSSSFDSEALVASPLRLEERRRGSSNQEAPLALQNTWIPNQVGNDSQASDGAEVRFGAGHPNDSLVHQLPDKSTRVEFTFVDGSKLFFNDQRKFGWVKLIPTAEVPNIDFMKKVGPEPLDASFTAEDFAARFARRKNTSIKAAILDQTVVAGVGNIYADESLWGAKIHPATLVKNVPNAKFKTLFTELQYVLNLSIQKGGSSNHTYVNAEGKKGSYMNFARVFRREGQACPRCGTTIEKLRVAGRGTHICPHCQQLKQP